MKKVGALMKEAGFNPKASEGVKEAYLKHLIKAATGVNVATPFEKKEISAYPKKIISMPIGANPPQQLSFDFDEDFEKIKCS